MIDRLISRKLEAEEKTLGASLDYLRHLARVSKRAFFKFALFTPLAAHRRVLPASACCVARIVASRDEDCGTCLQIEVNMARKQGVPAAVIRAVLDERVDALGPELADVYRFADAVVGATGGEDSLRPRLVARFGEEGLVELALAIASSRVFPVTKRALGYATSCARVEIEL